MRPLLSLRHVSLNFSSFCGRGRWSVVLLLLMAYTGLSAQAQRQASAAPEHTRVLVILDCSNSMWGRWQSDAKIKVTQQVLLRFLDSVRMQNHIDVALRVFGHLNNESYGTRLEVPFGTDNVQKLQSKIKTLVPYGGCDAASALTDALSDFPNSAKTRNIILIITDGMDDCSGNICEVARQVQLSGVIVQTFILGIGNPKDFKHSLDCAGRFTSVPNEEQYFEKLYEIFSLSDQKASITLELTDASSRCYETEVPVAFYDHHTHVVKYTTLYRYDSQSSPDTLTVDPLVKYDITFFTKPPITLEGRQFQSGRPNRLTVKADQGKLRLRHSGKAPIWAMPSYQVLVSKHGEDNRVATQAIGEMVNYCTGRYDLEVLTLPPTRIADVQVRSNSMTDLQIPMPGQLALTKPKYITSGSIFQIVDGVLIWVCDLNPNAVNERVTLMPGDYQLVIKPQQSNQYQSVQTARFTITSGQQTAVTIN